MCPWSGQSIAQDSGQVVKAIIRDLFGSYFSNPRDEALCFSGVSSLGDPSIFDFSFDSFGMYYRFFGQRWALYKKAYGHSESQELKSITQHFEEGGIQ